AERRSGLRRSFRQIMVAAGCLFLFLTMLTWGASAAPGVTTVSAVTTPVNGAWLESADGGHYWDAGGNGLCRIDVSAGGATENLPPRDGQGKGPNQGEGGG